MHAGEDPVDAAEVDVADQALPAVALVEDLDRSAVLQERDPGLGRRRVDGELASHALAKRR